MSTVQCVIAGSEQMALFALSLPKESIVVVEGAVALLDKPLRYTTVREVEIQVRKLYCINRADPKLPISEEDAGRSAEEFAIAEAKGVPLARVGQDTRLDHGVIDLRTPAKQAIFRIKYQVENKFREYLSSKDFIGIHTPKLIAGTSEGGAAVFKLEYKNGKSACLAQSPQLHKQLAICGGLRRVFEVGPVFRAEDSNTHRHLCEFVGLDAEMEIMRHYFEVCDIRCCDPCALAPVEGTKQQNLRRRINGHGCCSRHDHRGAAHLETCGLLCLGPSDLEGWGPVW